jgi:hypothetical protein
LEESPAGIARGVRRTRECWAENGIQSRMSEFPGRWNPPEFPPPRSRPAGATVAWPVCASRRAAALADPAEAPGALEWLCGLDASALEAVDADDFSLAVRIVSFAGAAEAAAWAEAAACAEADAGAAGAAGEPPLGPGRVVAVLT